MRHGNNIEVIRMIEYKFRYRFQHKKTKEIKTLYYTLPQIENGIWQHSKWEETLGVVPWIYEREWIILARDLFIRHKDKNDKEIYAEDIVDYEEAEKRGFPDLRINVVKWDEDRYRLSRYSAAGYFWDRMKIIGNIYENPELIK